MPIRYTIARIQRGITAVPTAIFNALGTASNAVGRAATYIPETAGNAIIAKGSKVWKNRKNRKK
jgi:hypothetical protein